jgi:hypothetical protein
MSVRYLNVDCILRSDYSLADAIDLLRPQIFVLWEEINSDRSSVGIETNLTNSKNPEEDILEFVKLFESLSPHLRQLINGCNEKIFDIGFEGSDFGNVLDVTLRPSTIQKIHELGFSVNIRIYPAEQSDKNPIRIPQHPVCWIECKIWKTNGD